MLRLLAPRLAGTRPLVRLTHAPAPAAATAGGAWARCSGAADGRRAMLSRAAPSVSWQPRRATRTQAEAPQVNKQDGHGAPMKADGSLPPHSTIPSPPTSPSPSPALSPPPSPSSSSPSSSEGALVRLLNDALLRMPASTVASFVILEIASFSATSWLLAAANVTTPSLFMLAYAISVPLRRAMLPKLMLGLPLAVILARVFPSLTCVNITLAAKETMKKMTPAWVAARVQQRRERQQAESTATADAPASPFSSSVARDRLWPWVRSLPDRYGLALLFAYRVVGALIVLGVYLALTCVGDVQGWVDWFLRGMRLLGFSSSVDVHAKSDLAGAFFARTVSAALFPAVVFLAPVLARPMHAVLMRLRPKPKL